MPLSSLERFGAIGLRGGVAVAFGVAAVLKLRDPKDLVEQFANYQLMPELANFVGITLPSIELTAGIVLLVGPRYWRHAAALIILGLLVVFTAALGRAWALGINLECGCFGVGSTHIGPWPILRNMGLATALMLGTWLDLRRAPEVTEAARRQAVH